MAIITDVDTTPVISHIHSDHLGSPQKITDASDNIVWDPVFQPFGSVATASGSLTANLRFPGQYFDGEAGLHQNWHREYDPETGRYIESDPIGLLGGINTYGYVNANPLRYMDPEGLAERGQEIGATVGAFAGAVIGGTLGGGGGLACGLGAAVCSTFGATEGAIILGGAGAVSGAVIGDKVEDLINLARDSLAGSSSEDCDCEKEWEEARSMCRDELNKQNPSHGITGGYRDVANCARGLVSQRCGGNRVEY